MKSNCRSSIICSVALAACFLIFSASAASGQTDTNLLVKPWHQGQMFDTSTDAVLESAAPTREQPKYDVQLSSYRAYGRWRVLPDEKATPRLGYDVSYFNVASDDPALPNHLWDGSIGFAQPIAEVNKWFVVLTGGAGYAGDTPFSDPHAAYFTGNVIVGREFSKDKAIVVALNYDGNRSFMPDVPIPGFAYADRYNEHFTFVLGLPVNSVTYEPVNGLQINAGWAILDTFSLHVGWEFLKHYSFYSDYTDRLTAFHLSRLPADRRLFLQEHRAEIGFRYNPTEKIRFSVGGGWAFGQEFSTGFDLRGTNALRHLRDGPFGRVLIEIGI